MKETTTADVELDADDAPRLLAAIRSNPDTAHVLAEIALGGDAAELLATLLPATDAEEDAAAPEETAPAAHAEAPQPSRPAFLGYVRESFWS